MGKKSTTDSVELHKTASQLLPGFVGVFTPDDNPKLTRSQPYAIVNTKPAPGEHWCALCYTEPGVLHYDSYGRSHSKLFPGKFKKGKDSDKDVEQALDTTECGQRCIAWLLCCHFFGPEVAELI